VARDESHDRFRRRRRSLVRVRLCFEARERLAIEVIGFVDCGSPELTSKPLR
jgi:hypothetical protein